MWLVAATPAQAQGGFDILTLRGPGSSIGVEISELDAEKAKSSSVENGVVVNSVRPDTPAARAGFLAGDIVVEFDGEAVRSVRQFRRLVEETRPGHEVKTTVVRDRNRRVLTVTPEPATAAHTAPLSNLPALRGLTVPAQPRVEPRAEAPFRFSEGITFTSRGRLGVTVTSLEPQLAEYFGARQGVLVTSVTADTPASRAGIKAGDVILEVAAQPVTNPADVNTALRAASAGATVDIKVLRDKKEVLLKATMPAAPSPAPERQRF
jgi:serine protease Do